MNANEREFLEDVTHKVIGAAIEVSNVLGAGFLEKVYENALLRELHRRGLRAERQKPLHVMYKGDCVGEYYVDILVEDCLVVELKCVDDFANEHLAQCLNYLRATDLHLALLLNSKKPKLQFRRVVHNL